jgi:hypothetical protein
VRRGQALRAGGRHACTIGKRSIIQRLGFVVRIFPRLASPSGAAPTGVTRLVKSAFPVLVAEDIQADVAENLAWFLWCHLQKGRTKCPLDRHWYPASG